MTKDSFVTQSVISPQELTGKTEDSWSLVEKSAKLDANLPNYPVPSFRKIANAVLRDAGNRMDRDSLEKLTRALRSLDDPLHDLFSRAATELCAADAGRNWATTRFKRFLLSLRTPLSDNSLCMTLNSSAVEQVSATAILLRGLAETYVNSATTEVVGSNGAGKRFETAQLSEMFATSRIPGAKVDELKTYPKSNHVVLWANGRAFRIDILTSSRGPIGLSTLASQVRKVITIAQHSKSEINVASLSTLLTRDQWALARDTYLSGNKMAMEWIESAITTVALHSCQPSRREERMRLARADTRDVYSDKTLGFSVFEDGSIAARMEHAVADGGFLALFLQVLSGHMSNLSSTIIDAPEFSLPSELQLSEVKGFGKINVSSAFPKIREIFVIHQNPDVLDLLRSTRMLNITVQLAFQAALFAVFKDTTMLISEPTSVRSFCNGRCDPNYILTKESVALARALQNDAPPEELFPLVVASMIVYQGLMRETKEGAAIGPGIGVLRNVLEKFPDSEEKSVIMETLSTYQSPPVFFTGVPLTPFIDAVEAFVFAPNQLAFTYTGGTDRLIFSVGASGFFAGGINDLQAVFEKCLLSMGTIVTAMASVESMYPSKSLQILGDYAASKDKLIEHGAVAIHAGAGEEFGLAPHERQLVEFVLSIVTFVGLQDVAAGHSAVDVAQSCVVALENCVFFNAGKGAVFNNDDTHELEASIVDGTSGECGAVAVLKTIKNPILAARAVKDQAEHPFLTGSAADEFAAAWGCATVPNAYFSSYGRRAQLAAVRRETLTNLHPQTVGATILDRWGNLAVASSTGGVVNKQAGRVGDTAVVGAGVFADQEVAVACSGQGDAFLRKSIASKIAFQRELNNMQHILDDLTHQTGATGAAVMVDRTGQIRIAQTSGAFFVAAGEKGKAAWAKVLVPPEENMPVFFENEFVSARLSSQPTTPGDSLLHLKSGTLDSMNRFDFADTLLATKKASIILKAGMEVERIALVATGNDELRLIPLHGVSPTWKSVKFLGGEFNESFPGYIHSKNGPKQSAKALDTLRHTITAKRLPAMSYKFIGEIDDDNLFARIVRGEVEQWRIWESATHVAFLTPFPNTAGYTVLVPRKHLDSNILSLSDTDFYDLASAIHEVSSLLKASLGVNRVGVIFEGMEIDYAHAKLIPIIEHGPVKARNTAERFSETYLGYVSSKPGPSVPTRALQKTQEAISKVSDVRVIRPPSTWWEPSTHCVQALKSPWYQGIYQIHNTLFHDTVKYFSQEVGYEYAITPVTTDCISSPMGLGSDSSPVTIDLMGQSTYLADSMQFTLEYLLRFNKTVPGVYYIAPSFRGEDPDSTHLNQFFHVECELRGTLEDAMKTAESYIYSLTKAYDQKHSPLIKEIAGTTAHIEAMLSSFNPAKGFPQVSLDDAIAEMPDTSCWEYAEASDHSLGRKLTRYGERILIARYGGFVWLTEMDHLSVPFYQAYVDGTDKSKAKAADLLMGLGETLGLGERHETAMQAAEALDHHTVPIESYRWYLDIRDVLPLKTSGWGMGSERYLCWLLRHDDVRDMHLIPRLKGARFLP